MDWRRITILFVVTFLSYFTGTETQKNRCSIPIMTALTSRNFKNFKCKRSAPSSTCKIPCKNGFIVKNEKGQEKNFTIITCRRKSTGVLEWDGFEICVEKSDNTVTTSSSTRSIQRTATTRTTPKPTTSVSCPNTPRGLASHQISNILCKNATPGSTCTVTCKPGFKATGTTLIQDVTCLDSGIWTEPRKTCSEITCPSSLPSIRQFQHLRSELDLKCGKSIGERCEVLCEQGYEDQSSPTTRITCTLSSNNRIGIWVGYRSKICTRKACAPLQLSPTTTGNCKSIPFGSTCEIRCLDGHEFSNGLFSKEINCQLIKNKVVWEPGIGTCQAKKCNPLQPIADATNNCSTVRFGSSCRIRCNDGYEFSRSRPTQKMTCGLKKNQVVLEPTPVATIVQCRRKTCALPQLPSLLVAVKCSNIPFGSPCEIQCPVGYKFSSGESTKQITCSLIMSKLVWKPPTDGIGTCERIKCPQITNTNFGTPPAGAYLPLGFDTCRRTSRSTCSLSCPDGYAFGGRASTSVSCDEALQAWKPSIQDVGFCTVKIVGNKNCEYWSSGTKSRGKNDAESKCKQIFGEKSVLAMPKTSDERNYANSALSYYLVGASNGDDSVSWDDGDKINEEISEAGNCITLRSKTLKAYDCSYLRYFICERPTVSYNPCLAKPCKSGGICIPYGCSFKCQCEPNFFGHICEKGPFDISIETPKPGIARGESISISYKVKSNAGKAGFTLYVNGEKQREVQDITNKWKSGTYTTKTLTNNIYISGKALLEAQPDSPVYKCIKVTVQNADEAVNITKDVCDGTVFDIMWKGLGTVATSSISYDIYLGDKLQGNSSSTRYKLQGLTTGTNYDIKVVPHLQGCTNKELFKVHKRRTSMGPPSPSSVHLPEANDRSISNCTIIWSNDRPKSIGGFKTQ